MIQTQPSSSPHIHQSELTTTAPFNSRLSQVAKTTASNVNAHHRNQTVPTITKKLACQFHRFTTTQPALAAFAGTSLGVATGLSVCPYAGGLVALPFFSGLLTTQS